MSTKITAAFDVTGWDEHQFDVRAGAAKLSRAKVTKTYSGDLNGTSVTEWLMAYSADGSATFVGMERIDATVGELAGTLVLQHVGKFVDGSANADLTVVAGACTGDLAGATGSGDFVANPAGMVRLNLQLG